eukprot:jgi/Hompol1/5238/HPOL_004271-RA
MNFAAFVQTHRAQLDDVPKTLWKAIYRKLCWDSEPLQLELLQPNEHGPGVRFQPRVSAEQPSGDSSSSGISSNTLDPESDVFVVEHMFSFGEEQLRTALQENSEAASQL